MNCDPRKGFFQQKSMYRPGEHVFGRPAECVTEQLKKLKRSAEQAQSSPEQPKNNENAAQTRTTLG